LISAYYLQYSPEILKPMYSSSELKLEPQEKHQSILGDQLHQLVRKLTEFYGIYKVKAIAPNLNNPRIVKFELQLIPNSELSEQIWQEIQNLVIDCEWQLRDWTQENWYFDAEVLRNPLHNSTTQDQILADSENL